MRKITAACILLAVAAVAVPALANGGGGGNAFRSRLTGTPGPSGPVLGSVAPGGFAWTVDEEKSRVRVIPDKELRVKAEGLLIAGTGTTLDGTTGGVTEVVLSLSCGSAAPIFTSGPVSLPSDGDFDVHVKATLPAHCIAPIVLVRAAVAGGQPVAGQPWIAVSGF